MEYPLREEEHVNKPTNSRGLYVTVDRFTSGKKTTKIIHRSGCVYFENKGQEHDSLSREKVPEDLKLGCCPAS